MNLWQDLIKVALLGTERQSLELPSPSGPLGDLLARLDISDQEGALLGAAAVFSLHQRAGQLPLTDNQPLPEPCELDDAPCCNSLAAQHLSLMLSGQYTEVLPEWLEAVAASGQRVPEERLPALLEFRRKQPELRESILPVLGKRGRWLAEQNPDWDYVVGSEDETTWQTSNSAARLLLLQRLRVDHPDQARELLISTWAEEMPDDRTAFLATFQTGLSMADEPFLEEALDDRRKEVRNTAVDLLVRLPNSRLSQRMVERVRPLITLTTGKKRKIDVILPESCDESMVRDGIEPKQRPGMGEKAWWLLQMLGAVPPSIWCQSWNAMPTELVEAAKRSEWKQPLLDGWALAARRHRDVEWAEALLTASMSKSTKIDTDGLMDVLPPERRESFILDILRSNTEPLNGNHPALSLLPLCLHTWSDKLTRAVLNGVRSHIADKETKSNRKLRSLLKYFALYMTPYLVHEVAAVFSTEAEDEPAWTRAVEEFLALLEFRNEMLRAIAQ